MRLFVALAERLKAAPTIMAEVQGEIVEGRRLTRLPAISIQIVSDPRPQHYKGFQRTRRSGVQVDVWAADADTAARLREAVIATLTSSATIGTVRFQRAMVTNVRAGGEPEQSGQPQRHRGEIARESIDFDFTHNAI